MLWNPQAIQLIEWAAEENSRPRAQKMIKIAEKMENLHRKDTRTGHCTHEDIREEYEYCNWLAMQTTNDKEE
jgi:tRNA A37 threonylcarbamoyladenosine biosynthesis protein TsaE